MNTSEGSGCMLRAFYFILNTGFCPHFRVMLQRVREVRQLALDHTAIELPSWDLKAGRWTLQLPSYPLSPPVFIESIC